MLEIKSLTKYYGEHRAIEDISFSVEQGEFVTLLGPSGCGKSTTLRSIAGLVEPTSGEIWLRGKNVTDLTPEDRRIGMVFQHSALFPHMTVKENIAYGLKMHDVPDEEIDGIIERNLELVHMDGYEDQKPGELSGGQQRRISLSRALAYEPDILLLDEPLTGLDRLLREDMRREIARIQEETGVTTVFVTHDQEEALSMSDRIIVLNDGDVVQEGSPKELYESPATAFVAEFVGKSSKFTGQYLAEDQPVVKNEAVTIPVREAAIEDGDTTTAYVRPEDIELTTRNSTNGVFQGTVTQISNIGNHSEVTIQLADESSVTAELDRFPDLEEGDTVKARVDPEKVILL